MFSERTTKMEVSEAFIGASQNSNVCIWTGKCKFSVSAMSLRGGGESSEFREKCCPQDGGLIEPSKEVGKKMTVQAPVTVRLKGDQTFGGG